MRSLPAWFTAAAPPSSCHDNSSVKPIAASAHSVNPTTTATSFDPSLRGAVASTCGMLSTPSPNLAMFASSAAP